MTAIMIGARTEEANDDKMTATVQGEAMAKEATDQEAPAKVKTVHEDTADRGTIGRAETQIVSTAHAFRAETQSLFIEQGKRKAKHPSDLEQKRPM